MIRLINAGKAEGILARFAPWIETVSGRYGVPAALVKAVLYQEMTAIDLLDPMVDFAVEYVPGLKSDSSTGYAQVFGYVGLNAVNFACDRGLATYGSLGITADHRLDPSSRDDVRAVWLKLRKDPKFNIEAATLNLLVAAEEMTGRIDFDSFTDDELKLVLTRYNADVKHVTPYGEQAFQRYVELSAQS